MWHWRCHTNDDVTTVQQWLLTSQTLTQMSVTDSGAVRGSHWVTALYHCFLDKITVIPLLTEGNYSFASVTEKAKRNIAHWGFTVTVTSRQILGLLHCLTAVLDTVGWVIWPVKIVPNMTYNVFGGTLNPTVLLLDCSAVQTRTTKCSLVRLRHDIWSINVGPFYTSPPTPTHYQQLILWQTIDTRNIHHRDSHITIPRAVTIP